MKAAASSTKIGERSAARSSSEKRIRSSKRQRRRRSRDDQQARDAIKTSGQASARLLASGAFFFSAFLFSTHICAALPPLEDTRLFTETTQILLMKTSPPRIKRVSGANARASDDGATAAAAAAAATATCRAMSVDLRRRLEKKILCDKRGDVRRRAQRFL